MHLVTGWRLFYRNRAVYQTDWHQTFAECIFVGQSIGKLTGLGILSPNFMSPEHEAPHLPPSRPPEASRFASLASPPSRWFSEHENKPEGHHLPDHAVLEDAAVLPCAFRLLFWRAKGFKRLPKGSQKWLQNLQSSGTCLSFSMTYV